MELVTGVLDSFEYKQEIAFICRFLKRFDIHTVNILLAFGCDLEQSILPIGSDIPIPTSQLVSFLNGHEAKGIFRLGASDIYIKEDIRGIVEFYLCDENDIHCYSDDAELTQVISSRWQSLYFYAYEADRELSASV